MKTIGSALVVAFFVSVFYASAASQMQADDGWSWSKLNLLELSDTEKKSKRYEPLGTTTRAQSDDGPSMLSRMGSSSKKMFRKTTDTLTFKKKKTPTKPSSRFSPNLGAKKKKKEAESGIFGNWFSDSRSRGPSTAEEFLEQPRLKP